MFSRILKDLCITLVVGGVVTIALTWGALKYVMGHAGDRFDFEADRLKNAVAESVNAGDAVAKSMQALFLSSQDVDADQFRIFFKEIFARYPFIRSASYCPRVDFSERREFEEEQRYWGFITFRIFRYDEKAVKEAAGDSSHYYPVIYKEPFSPDDAALIGHDLFSVPDYREGIRRAVESGLPIPVAREGESSRYTLFVAVYRSKAFPENRKERKDKVNGLIAMTLHADGMFGREPLPPNLLVELDLLSPRQAGGAVRLFSSPREGRGDPAGISVGVLEGGHDIGISAQEFHLRVTRRLHLEDLNLRPVAAALAAGLVFSCGFFIIVRVRGKLKRELLERERARGEMRHLRNYLKNIIDSMPSLLVGVDAKGRVTLWNLGAEKETGILFEDARGMMLSDLFPALADVTETIPMALEKGEPLKDQRIFEETGEGEKRISQVTVYPLTVGDETGAVILSNDITDRVRLEEMMVQTEKMMSVGGLAAGMAHEINNPLGAIIQGIQVVQLRVSPDLPKNVDAAAGLGIDLSLVRAYLERRSILEFLVKIRESADRAARIIDHMMEFSRKSDSKVAPFDLAGLIDRSVELASSDYDLRKKYDFRHIEIQRSFDPHLPKVLCVATEIEQVLLNLLRNAAQAMGQLKERRPRIILRTRREGGMARIEVADNGPGMDEKTRKRVFEPFFTTKKVGLGTGLGLSVSYFIVTTKHRGRMRVESAPGRGCCFFIDLPLSAGQKTQP